MSDIYSNITKLTRNLNKNIVKSKEHSHTQFENHISTRNTNVMNKIHEKKLQ